MISIAFKDQSGNIIRIPALSSTTTSPLSGGDVVFKIPNYIYDQVLYDDTPKNFYIVADIPGASETILYTGQVDKIENISNETARLQTITNQAASPLVTSTVTGTTSTPVSQTPNVSAPTVTVDNTSTAPSVTLPTTGATNQSVLQQLINANSQAVSNIAAATAVAPAVIPGYSQDTNAQSMKSGLTPVSTQTTTVKLNTSSLSQAAGTTVKLNA